MTDLVALQQKNGERWKAAKLTRGPQFGRPAQIAVAHKAIYLDIQHRTGVHWIFVACTHYRESDQNFSCNLGQGDPLDRKTVHVPAGRGPFLGPNAFADGGVDALVNCAPYAARINDWSIESILTWLERYNGLRYANSDRPSPYVWSGTSIYDPPSGPGGKVLVDHGPIEPVVDEQLGCAGLILAIMALDPSVVFDESPAVAPAAIEPPLDAEWLQKSLNTLGATPALVVDGINGANTRQTVRAFQQIHGLTVDGIAGPETIAAIQAELAQIGA